MWLSLVVVLPLPPSRADVSWTYAGRTDLTFPDLSPSLAHSRGLITQHHRSPGNIEARWMLARLVSTPLAANSRISRGRINPPLAKYARTIRSAMRDPEISPRQSSCFRRPLAGRGGGEGTQPVLGVAGWGRQRVDERTRRKGCNRQCVPVKNRDSPRLRVFLLAYLLAFYLARASVHDFRLPPFGECTAIGPRSPLDSLLARRADRAKVRACTTTITRDIVRALITARA
jgi:hypothetical protein